MWPKHIMMNLKGRIKDNLTNIKQVYSAHKIYKKFVKAEKSEMQHLFKCLKECKYVLMCRSKCESTTVQDMFWGRLEYIMLFNTFPTVLIMDSTYKTDTYKMPLF